MRWRRRRYANAGALVRVTASLHGHVNSLAHDGVNIRGRDTQNGRAQPAADATC